MTRHDIPEVLEESIEERYEALGFATKTELVRHAVRNFLDTEIDWDTGFQTRNYNDGSGIKMGTQAFTGNDVMLDVFESKVGYNALHTANVGANDISRMSVFRTLIGYIPVEDVDVIVIGTPKDYTWRMKPEPHIVDPDSADSTDVISEDHRYTIITTEDNQSNERTLDSIKMANQRAKESDNKAVIIVDQPMGGENITRELEQILRHARHHDISYHIVALYRDLLNDQGRAVRDGCYTTFIETSGHECRELGFRLSAESKRFLTNTKPRDASSHIVGIVKTPMTDEEIPIQFGGEPFTERSE